MTSVKEKFLFQNKFRETTFRRHFKLFEGESEEFIRGFVFGFAYFLKHGFNRHLQDIENITSDLERLKDIGVNFEEPLPGEWWQI